MKRKVLVVDDDLAIVEVLEMRLVAMGYEVTATSDAEKALNAVDGARFDLALIDLRMAPTDGIALMESVHTRQPRLPVLIMTAHGTIETAVDAVQRGAFDYLTKPFLRDELRAKIGRALASRRWAATASGCWRWARRWRRPDHGARPRRGGPGCGGDDRGRALRRLPARARAPGPDGQLRLAAPSWPALEAAAAEAMAKGVPVTFPGSAAGAIVAAPLVVQRGPAGALVIETAAGIEPTEDDLELLALFSSQAAVAVRNTHELERLRTGAWPRSDAWPPRWRTS